MRTKLALMAALGTILCVWSARPAFADSIQLSCATCVSVPGGTSLISDANPVTFSFIDTANQSVTGNGFIAILVPTGGSAPTLTGQGATLEGPGVSFTTGSLASALGESFTNYNFGSFQNASQEVGLTPSGYKVYEFDLGSITLGPKGGINGLTANAPGGSVIVGYIETSGGTYWTPLSESIAVPEPNTLWLLGLGFISLAGLSIVLVRLRRDVGSGGI